MTRAAHLAALLMIGVVPPPAGAAAAPRSVATSPAGSSAGVADNPLVTVTRNGDAWSAEYVFSRDVPVWAFQHSALTYGVDGQPWRTSIWTVETPGVILDRQGRYDVLRTVDGGPVPRRVRIALRPTSFNLQADYDPSLVFTDGTVALYSDQFDVLALPGLEAARALPLDLNDMKLDGGPVDVTWRDAAGPVLFKGERVAAASATSAQTYVVFGDARTQVGEAVTTVIDPGLPAWLGDKLATFTPQVMSYYAGRLGPSRSEGSPTLMVSWKGPTQGKLSMGGSVLPGLIVMVFEGEGVLDPEKSSLDRAHWFIGHESAHFWLGSNGLRYAAARDSWITEGGADLMAIRAIATLDPTYDARVELQQEVDDCIAMARDKPVASANERGENRTYYACGAIWSLAIEAASKRHGRGDFFDVLIRFQSDNPEGVLTRAEWLDAMTRLAGDDGPSQIIAKLLDTAVADPLSQLASLFDHTGVAYHLDAGCIILD